MQSFQRWRRAVFATSQRRLRALQNRLGNLLGCPPDRRGERLAELMQRNPAEATGYWLQLVVAMGIATLGLVLDSTAVVIGAMLIAPLMTPIVGLGMGLAVGSPFLVLRSLLRINLSVVCVVLGSAALTSLLPFHELTDEIAARTAPTALDLLTAAFCALAGAYAAMRPGSTTATTAAGTSIGISLVPPLCASGYGVGTATWSVAGGAALLFTANLTAIVVVGTLLFMAAGFNRVNVSELERRELERTDGAGLARAMALALSRVFASSGGFILRLLMPLLLLVVVYTPLRSALDEVAWQIRVRSRVDAVLKAMSSRIVEQRLRAERGAVELSVILLGTTVDGEALEQKLAAALTDDSRLVPHLEVVAIPDAKALSGLASLLRTERTIPTVDRPPSPKEELGRGREVIREALAEYWPERALGPVGALWIDATASDSVLRVAVVRAGEPMDEAARSLLERALSDKLQTSVTVADRAVPKVLLGREAPSAFLVDIGRMLQAAELLPDARLCVSEPASDPRTPLRLQRELEAAHAALESIAARSHRVVLFLGPELRAELVKGPCAPAAPPP